jgi:pSer/pThr/pTyr-binding forkhead associated (FHA) protein
MPYQLIPAAAEAAPVILNKAIFLFGRHPECDVVITSSRKVSRKHCCLAQINQTFVVRDLGSMNGVRVNGVQVRKAAELRPGDELTVGDVVFHLRSEPANGRRQPARRPPSERQRKPVPPHMISQDIPVIIPEEERSFAVEESLAKSTTDSDMIVNPDIDDDSALEVEVID